MPTYFTLIKSSTNVCSLPDFHAQIDKILSNFYVPIKN